MSESRPRRTPLSGPLDPAEELALGPEQLELLPGASAERPERGAMGQDVEAGDAAGEGWRPPLAVSYADPAALPESDGAEPAEQDLDLPYWLAFNRVKGIGPARFALLLGTFVTARAAWEAAPAAWRAAGLDERTAASLARQRTRIAPDAEWERLVRLRVQALTIKHTGYPKLLREIAQPPPVLYVRGELTPADDWAVAIVGTRRASAYGRQVTERLAGELAAQSITIVSGLARGIDTHAHNAARAVGRSRCSGAALTWSTRLRTRGWRHALSSREQS